MRLRLGWLVVLLLSTFAAAPAGAFRVWGPSGDAAGQWSPTMHGSLELGFFIQPVHPPSRPYADVLREDREAVVLADRLGYREAFIGEHLVDSAETITSPRRRLGPGAARSKASTSVAPRWRR